MGGNQWKMDDISKTHIIKSAAWRMGKWFTKKFDASTVHIESLRRSDNPRSKKWVERWYKMGIRQIPDIFIDSADARHSKIYPLDSIHPVITHNRLQGTGQNILTCLNSPTLIDLTTNDYKDQYNWEQKIPTVIWRGGWCSTNNKNYIRAKNDRNIVDTYEHYQRINVCINKGQYLNIKLVPLSKNLLTPPIKSLIDKYPYIVGDRLNFYTQICSHRYILCLDGHDYPSNIISVLRSNSIAFIPVPIVWDTIIHENLTPWEHYIPIDPSGSDIEEKIEWCNNNPRFCIDMIKAANSYISTFTGEREIEIDRVILNTLIENQF